MPAVYVVDLPEFSPVLEGARLAGYEIQGPRKGYWAILHEREIRFERKKIGLGPALWNTALAGGTQGVLSQFDANVLVLVEG